MIFFFLTLILNKNHEYNCLKEINLYRQQHGLQPLIQNPNLSSAARKQSKHQRDIRTCTHTGPSGNEFFYSRIKNAGYNAVETGENVAIGYGTGYKKLLDRWKNSATENRNILNQIYNETGIACEIDAYDNKAYWTQVFAKKNNYMKETSKINEVYPYIVVKSETMSKGGKLNPSSKQNHDESIQSKMEKYRSEIYESRVK